MAKPFKATSTVTVDDGSFGGTTQAHVSGNATWVLFSIQAEFGGEVGYVPVSNGVATIQLGPTPTWSEGAGSGTAVAGNYDGAVFVRTSNPTTFTVSA